MTIAKHNLAGSGKIAANPISSDAQPTDLLAPANENLTLATHRYHGVDQPANDNGQREQLDAYWQASRTPFSPPWQSAFTKMWWLP